MTGRILVAGGAGAFGRRLVEGLLATTSATVVVAGRTLQPGDSFMAALMQRYGESRVEAVRLDRNDALEALRLIQPFCVVDAAGPFQNGEPHLARAAIAAGCHYVDLADARDIIAGFVSLDPAAKEAGVLAVTGASSTPALSGAAVEDLTRGWREVEEIAVAISPGNRAPRGLSVVEAILAYAGRPVRVWIDGRWTERPGWGELVRADMSSLGRRWLSLCETPDLDLLAAWYPSARAVRFRAGLELPILHFGLWLMSLLVRAGAIRSLRPYAKPLHRIASWFERFGTDRGGMCVEVKRRDEAGRRAIANWSLVAEAGDGPNIPVLPALSLIRRLLDGQIGATGAKIASELLSLDAIEAEFRRFRIGVRRGVCWPGAEAVLEKAIGPDAKHLPDVVREAHTSASVHLRGRASIEGAEHWAGRAIARAFGFPAGSADTDGDVLLKRRGEEEIWTRRFGGSRFRSTLRAAHTPRRIYERFGPFEFELDVRSDSEGFGLSTIGWRIGPLPLPARLAPRTPSRAFRDAEGRYSFDVTIVLPIVGRLVRYCGWLLPQDRHSGKG